MNTLQKLARACQHMLENMECLGLHLEGWAESMDEARDALAELENNNA